MGLPRDVSSGATYVDFTAIHHTALCVQLPYATIHTPYGMAPYVFRRAQGDILGDVLPASRSGE